MFQRETLLNQFSIDYFAQLAADVTPEHFNLKPAGGCLLYTSDAADE